MTKNVEELSLDDWKEFPIWEFTNDNEEVDDLLVRPVIELPVTHMNGRAVSTKLRLANGTHLQAVLSNVDLDDEESTKTFLLVCFFNGNEKFFLGRYFDHFYHRAGPIDLGEFLGLDVASMFPMNYDISDLCLGKDSVVRGKILAEPTKRLSKSERMELVFRKQNGTNNE